MEKMEGKKKLIDKYEIPLNHLDFAYISECTNAREIEKIVQILRSGEEGHFPDLTKCAENKLRELKPNSRLFRYEEQLLRREALSSQDWKPIFEWTNNIKVKDSKLLAAAENMAANIGAPPVRKGGTIKPPGDNVEPKICQSQTIQNAESSNKANDCIKSTDYQKWDKYDAEEECLRMELAEERAIEEVERKNRLNKQKSKPLQFDPDMKRKSGVDDFKEHEVFSKLTEVERERLAEEYRLRGNDYFRAKEYENAIHEYDRSIAVCPEKAAPAYNNRAAAKIKLKWYSDAVKDCEQCLEMEPENVKAMLRLADATYCDGARQESYAFYMKVLKFEPGNSVALRATAELKGLYGELPPPTATRLQIAEECSIQITKKDTKSKTQPKRVVENTKSTKNVTSTASSSMNQLKTKSNDYDLADLIKPNRLIKNKLANAAVALTNMKASKIQNQIKQQTTPMPTVNSATNQPSRTLQSELRLSNYPPKASNGKIFIQEI